MTSDLIVLKRLLAVTAPQWRPMLLALFLGFAAVAAGIGLMSTSAYLISLAALRPSIAELRVAIVGVRFFGISRGVFRYLERLLSHLVTFNLLTHVRVWFYRALEPLAPARLLEYRSGDVLSRIVADIGTLENFHVRVIGPSLVALLVVGLTWILLSSLNAPMALVVALIMIGASLVVSWLGRALGRRPGQRLISLRSEMNASLVDGIQGVADLLAFDGAREYRAQVTDISRQFEAQNACMARIRGLLGAVGGLTTDATVFAALWMAVPLVSTGSLRGVYLAVIALTVMAAFEAMVSLPLAYQHLEETICAARRLFDIIDEEPAVGESVRPAPVPCHYSLSVEDVCFSYCSKEGPPALNGVSFSIPEGGHLAVVGPSGAGKSTLVNLILRFWDPGKGTIRLGGKDTRCLSAEELRRSMGVVSQESYLFSGTIKENLCLGRPFATEEELAEAAHRGKMHDFIKTLPQAYDTWIGEHGMRLSGGERQRLIIVRTLLKDAPLIILDEPTANLDPLTERSILQEIRSLFAGKSVLLITHRLVELDWMDEIVVLHEGKVVERGRQVDLLEQKGLYRKMRDIQRGTRLADWILLDDPIGKVSDGGLAS